MTGQDAILKLRRAGLAPACIWVDDYIHPYAEGGTVCLHPADVPEQQDWRFVVGLPVLIASHQPERLSRIAAAIGEYASRVISNLIHTDAQQRDWHGRPVVHVISIADTNKEFTWQK